MSTTPLLTAIARCCPESFLLKHGLWDECSGDPMNVWAEEFDRRDASKAPATNQDKA